MGHPDRLLPEMAAAFAQLGYRAATTAELAQRCGVRENVLYRVWASKKEMFLAAIDYVFDSSLRAWRALIDAPAEGSAQRILAYEALHHGEFGLYRIVFAALAESKDPEIRRALQEMYKRFHDFIAGQLTAQQTPRALLVAWAMIGLATMSNISRELELMEEPERRALFTEIGQLLIR